MEPLITKIIRDKLNIALETVKLLRDENLEPNLKREAFHKVINALFSCYHMNERVHKMLMDFYKELDEMTKE